jgi:hypothetical protein
MNFEPGENRSLIERHWRRSIHLIATIWLLSSTPIKWRSLRGFVPEATSRRRSFQNKKSIKTIPQIASAGGLLRNSQHPRKDRN